jgi:UDP-glucose 4-epimerase
MTVLVTGGAGFLGSHLVDALVDAGEEVLVFDNLNRGSRANIGVHVRSGAVTFIDGDIRNYAAVLEAATGVEVVYHLAAQSNVLGALTDTDYSFTTNVAGTYNVLKAAASTGVRRLVFSSSREVYGEPESIPVPESAPLTAKNAYGASKIAGETYCRVWEGMTGLQCQVLRFANVYGPRDRDRVIPIWLDRARRGEPLQLYGGEQLIDFLWVGTAVESLLAAAGSDLNGPVNIGSGVGVTLPYLAQRLLEETRSPSKLEILPARPVEVVRFVADISQMQRVIGVTPDADPLAHLSACLEEVPMSIGSSAALGYADRASRSGTARVRPTA